ncbi:alkaline phosphatase family protein [Sphingomonas sp. BK580]|uniref:alkaline phosphatase family protein n=1 Tax=Sphingomonas sp. BK580 TaxID=2586972 RepID=UPI00161E2AB9|nr:alkaline phosphatase family protein [Sphingomonas sp. BK580]MBB3693586.1 phospholipase C [Sphingomonas sp. BK580]
MEIGTIVVAMMENRSFDHMLGHLSLEGRDVEGLRSDAAWLGRVANRFGDAAFGPFRMPSPYDTLDADPPHGRAEIAVQLGSRAGGRHAMDGFVKSYAPAKGAKPVVAGGRPPVMGYFDGSQAPITRFFADNFAVCDHWHAALPAGTQPNRLMAMSGTSRIDANKVPLPHQELVYDWLTRRGIRWRVYHAGIPFFTLMLDRVDDILSGRFRPFSRFFDDVVDEDPGTFPQVIFLEPIYSDAPHVGPACDDHAPAGIVAGQQFLLQAYRALRRSRSIWQRSVMVVTYDEHGGFFDHVPPPDVPTEPPPDAFYSERFETLGVRVPAMVVSPFVRPGSVHHGVLDHTSILKFIGQRFGNGAGYSSAVDGRAVGSVLDALDNPAGGRAAPVPPSLEAYVAAGLRDAGRMPGTVPDTPIQTNFQQALQAIRRHPVRPAGVYDELLAAFPEG